MRRSLYRLVDYLEAAQNLEWATQEQFVRMITGKARRHGRTEKVLLRLVRQGKLVAIPYGNRLIYSAPRRVQYDWMKEGYEIPKEYRAELMARFLKIEHGLASTEEIVRIKRANLNSQILPPRWFVGTGSVPDWAFLYPGGKLLLGEHTTMDNFYRAKGPIGKIIRYQKSLPSIQTRFDAREAVVVFVIEAPRSTVETFVRQRLESGLYPFYFIDYESFCSAPLGGQLDAPIYIWGGDGQAYPLRQNA